MLQARRPEIEELLTLLFDEIEPRKDEYIADYRRRVETQLKVRIDISNRDWFIKRIQIAFEAWQKSFQKSNVDVIS